MEVVSKGILSTSFLFLFFFVGWLISNEAFVLIAMIVVSCLEWYVYYALHKNAYCFFEISNVGIRNRYLQLRWDEIDSYRICAVREIRFRNFRRVYEFSSMVSFGESCEGDFRVQSPRKCVFFSMTSKNMQALARFSEGKSKAVNDFLSKYSNVDQ